MPITEKTHPYRVQLSPDMVVAFPASMSLQSVEAACKQILDEQRPTKKQQRPAPASKSQPKSPKSASILGAESTASGVAGRLSQILDGVDPNTASEQEKDEIFQSIIAYRQIARSLPEEQRAVLDRKIAAFNNTQVKQKPARKR